MNRTKVCLALLGAFVFMMQVMSSGIAEDKKSGSKSDEIKIRLKDFKFKPPETVTNPDSVFVFDEDSDRLCFFTGGPAEAKFKIPADGDWDVVVSAAGDTAVGVHTVTAQGEKVVDVHPNFQLGVDGKNIGKEVTLRTDDRADYKITVPLKMGEHKLSIAFTNDMYKDGEYDSNLYLHGVKLVPHTAEADKKSDEKKDVPKDNK